MDATVQAVTAHAFQRAPAENLQHHCPLCRRTMDWPAFQAHAPDCISSHPDHPAVQAAQADRE